MARGRRRLAWSSSCEGRKLRPRKTKRAAAESKPRTTVRLLRGEANRAARMRLGKKEKDPMKKWGDHAPSQPWGQKRSRLHRLLSFSRTGDCGDSRPEATGGQFVIRSPRVRPLYVDPLRQSLPTASDRCRIGQACPRVVGQKRKKETPCPGSRLRAAQPIGPASRDGRKKRAGFHSGCGRTWPGADKTPARSAETHSTADILAFILKAEWARPHPRARSNEEKPRSMFRGSTGEDLQTAQARDRARSRRRSGWSPPLPAGDDMAGKPRSTGRWVFW